MSIPSNSKVSSWREAVAQFVRSRSRTTTVQRKPSVDEKSPPSASPSQRRAHQPTSGAFSADQQKIKEEVEEEEGKSTCPALVMLVDGAVQLFPEGTVAADVLAMHRGTHLGSLTDRQVRPDVRLRAGETYFLTPLPCCDGAGCCDCRSSCSPAGPSSISVFDPSSDEHGLYYQQQQHQLQRQQRHLDGRSSRRSMEVGAPTTDLGGSRLWPLAASFEDHAAAVGCHGTHCYRPLCSGPCTAAPWELQQQQQQQQQQLGAIGCSCRMCSLPEPSFLEDSEPATGSPHGCVDCTSARHPNVKTFSCGPARFSSDVRSSPVGPAGVACAPPPSGAAAAAMVGEEELVHSHHAPQQQQPPRHLQPQHHHHHHHQQQHQHHQRLQRQHSHSFTSIRQPRASMDSAAAAAHLRWSGGFPAGKPATWHPAAGVTHCSCSAHQEQKSQQHWQQKPWPQHQFQHILGPGATGNGATGCCAASATAKAMAEAQRSWHVLPWREWQRQGEERVQQRRRSVELGAMWSGFKGSEGDGGGVPDRSGAAWPGAVAQMSAGCMHPCPPSTLAVHGQCGEMHLGMQLQGGQLSGGAGGQLARRNPGGVSLRRSSMSQIEIQSSARVSVSGAVRVSTPPKPPKSPEQTRVFDSLSSSESFPDLTGEAGLFPDMSGGTGPLEVQGWAQVGHNKGMQKSPKQVSLRDRLAGKAQLLKQGSEVQGGAGLACEVGPLLYAVDSDPSPLACAGAKTQKPPRQQVKGTAGGVNRHAGEGTKSAGPFAPALRQRAELRRVASASTMEVNNLDASQAEGHQTRRWVDLAYDDILSGREGEEEAWSEAVGGPLTAEGLIIRPGCFKVFDVGTTQPC